MHLIRFFLSEPLMKLRLLKNTFDAAKTSLLFSLVVKSLWIFLHDFLQKEQGYLECAMCTKLTILH